MQLIEFLNDLFANSFGLKQFGLNLNGSGSTRPGTNSAPESTRQGQLGLFIFLMVNRDITYVTNKKFVRYDLEYAR